MNKKVLIITYYWPPSGGSGVQRWLKFVKYLPAYGWKPYVFTPADPSFDTKDESLLKDVPREAEVIRFPIWEPYGLFKFFSKKKGSGTFVAGKSKQSLFQKLSVWIRGNFFIPDPRVFWVLPSVKFLSNYLKQNQIHTIVTTGPPHSVHLIGLKLKRKNPSLKWIADFRDPWSEWGFLDSLKVAFPARTIHRYLEQKVLTAADSVVTITPFYKKQFERLAGRNVSLLTNGFDEDDFINFKVVQSELFWVRHVGIVNEKCDPRPFMKAIEVLCNEREDVRRLLRVEYVGSVHASFREFVTTNPLMAEITVFTDPVPHTELIKTYSTSSLLILILTGYKDAEGYMPGKLFEYLATSIPVLGVGPIDGDAAELLSGATAGKMIASDNIDEIKSMISQLFDSWQESGIVPVQSEKAMANHVYSRRVITKELSDLLQRLSS